MSDPRSEARVAAVLEGYLASAKAGSAPDREALVAAHPDLADALNEALLGLAFVEDAGSVLALPDQGSPPRLLGDFKIVAEVGRGGMGVVYEAEQVSLHRRVALKVLPFAGTLDTKQLQRFRNEAQAAAHLHHTNIVPVYSVGSERGVHYYAMQFIEGESLAHAIRELSGKERGSGGSPISSHPSHREPTFLRMAARIGMQAAEALDHAHQLGIVHRDIKPGNLLVDTAGNLWVTDFGLARFSSEPALTVTGDLVGTFRYMSPEQALAKRVPIDHRTDVYSLGATLYELVTLEPAVRGEDPQAVLQEIAFKDPTPPRRLNPAIPAALETILQKAMWKDPAGRYATAQEMADDLRRFLEHLPIRARPPTLLNHAAKWARRHRIAVGVGAGFLALLLVGLAVGVVLLAREKRKTDDNYALALAERQQAEQNLAVARDAIDEMLTQVGADELMNTPMLEPLRRELLRKAAGFYQGLLDRHGDDPALRHEAAKAWFRYGCIRELLGEGAQTQVVFKEAAARLDPLVQEFPDVEAYRITLSNALDRSGDERRAVAVWDVVRPVSREGRLCLARAHNSLALALGDQDDKAGKESELRKALGIIEDLPREAQDDREVLRLKLAALNNLRTILVSKGLEQDTVSSYREAVDVAERLVAAAPHETEGRVVCALEHHNFGAVLSRLGRQTDAVAEYHRSLEIFEILAREFPSVPSYRENVGGEHQSLALSLAGSDPSEAERHGARSVEILGTLAQESGRPSQHLVRAHWIFVDVLKAQGRADAAEEHLRVAVELCTKLVADEPGSADSRWLLVSIQCELGGMFAKQRRFEEGEGVLRAAIEQVAEIEKVGPLSQRLRHQRGVALGHYGSLLRDSDRAAEAERLYGDAIESLGKLVAECPDAHIYRNTLANCLLDLGALLYAAGNSDGAAARFEEARKHYAEIASRCPEVLDYREGLAKCLGNLAQCLLKSGREGEAESFFKDCVDVREEIERTHPSAANQQALWRNLHLLGNRVLRDRPADAEPRLRRAVELQEAFLRDSPSNPANQTGLGGALHNHANALRRLGRQAETPAIFERAIGLERSALAADPKNSGVRAFLANHYDSLSAVLLELDDLAGAAEAAAGLAEAQPENADRLCQAGLLLVVCSVGASVCERIDAAERASVARAYAEQAKEILARATELAPGTPLHWSALGRACIRTEDWQGTVEALDRDLDDRDEAFDWFLLATAHARLGHTEQARRWYDRAIARQAAQGDDSIHMQTVRAEVARLLGISDE